MPKKKLNRDIYAITTAGRITIPSQYLDELGWEDGDFVKYFCNKDKKEIVLKKVKFVLEE